MGLAMHESQSLFMEMQIARSAAYVQHRLSIFNSRQTACFQVAAVVDFILERQVEVADEHPIEREPNHFTERIINLQRLQN